MTDSQILYSIMELSLNFLIWAWAHKIIVVGGIIVLYFLGDPVSDMYGVPRCTVQNND